MTLKVTLTFDVPWPSNLILVQLTIPTYLKFWMPFPAMITLLVLAMLWLSNIKYSLFCSNNWYYLKQIILFHLLWNVVCFQENKTGFQPVSRPLEQILGLNRPWWPIGLRRHAISQLIVATKGPGFESLPWITISISQS